MSNSMDCIFVKTTDKTIALKEFLRTDPSTLNEAECKIQEALSYLYKKNNKKPPLFKEFPDRGQKKLTIDCTTAPMDDWIAAQYLDKENIIEFSSTSKITNLIETLAHELKHAEQTSDELLSMHENNMQIQQLNFLCEAQAFTFETYISALMRRDHKKNLIFNENPTEKNENENHDEWCYSEGLTDLENGNYDVPNVNDTLQKIVQKHFKRKKFNYAEYEKEAISAVLPILYTGIDNYNYRVEYDKDYPFSIGEKLDHIPASLNLPSETQNTLFPILNRIPPSDVTFPRNALYRYFLYAAATGDFDTVSNLLNDIHFHDYCDIFLDPCFSKKTAIDYTVDMMVDHNAPECLHILTDGWDKDKVSQDAQYYYLKYRLSKGGTIEEIFTDNLDDEITVNAVFLDINLKATNVDGKNPTVSFESLKEVDQKESKMISFFLNDVENEICDIHSVMKIQKLSQAAQYGHIESTKVLLDAMKEDHSDNLNKIFSNISFNWQNLGKLPKEQKKYIFENSKEILLAFLNLKNEDGRFIIRPQSIENLIKHSDAKTLEILSDYQQENPTDKRFSKLKIPKQKKQKKPMKKRLSSLTLTGQEKKKQSFTKIATHRGKNSNSDSSKNRE